MRRLVLLAAAALLCIAPRPMAQEEAEPIPYSPDEFPEWALDLRRAEIISIGMFPLAFIFTRVGYDLARFGVISVQRGETASEYAPWFFAPPGKPDLTKREKRGIIVASISISGAVALIDYILGQNEQDS